MWLDPMNTCKQCLHKVTKKCMSCPNELGPVPERLISANPGLKFCSVLCSLLSYVFLRITFCVIVTVSQRKGSAVFCKLKLHVLRQETLLKVKLNPGLNLIIFQGTRPWWLSDRHWPFWCSSFLLAIFVSGFQWAFEALSVDIIKGLFFWCWGNYF